MERFFLKMDAQQVARRYQKARAKLPCITAIAHSSAPLLALDCVHGHELGANDSVAGLKSLAVMGRHLLDEGWVVRGYGRNRTLSARVEDRSRVGKRFDALA